ncbi:MAG: DNA mismatch repair protein MutS, partial [Candidatus Sumerlaeia bacterium]|nr:DNA mismatch repair protein MutS [Candidatus Sumerlaeia bacterium]
MPPLMEVPRAMPPQNVQTPMMRQYYELKDAHPGTILLFRCGDFYETYGEDAEEAGRLLNIIVTGKAAGADGRIPMAGVPYHAIDTYIARLVRAGKRIAIAEQVEDPKQAKGLVAREVVRVITPGTAMEEGIVEDTANNYLVCLCKTGRGTWGVALADLSTGYFGLTEVSGVEAGEELLSELARIEPREILLPNGLEARELGVLLAERPVAITRLPETDYRLETARRVLLEHYKVQSLEGFGAEDFQAGVQSAGALMQYLKDTQKSSISHIQELAVRWQRDTMVLDAVTQRSLELVRNIHGGGKEATLLSVLDRSETPMGARMLRSWILEPLRDETAIRTRQDAVEEFTTTLSLRGTIKEQLRGVKDIERIVSRAAVGSASPRDLATLRSALERLPAIRTALVESKSDLLRSLGERLDMMGELRDTLTRALVEEPPARVSDGGVIREGYSADLDEVAQLARGGKDFIAQIRQGEAERTGVSNLKIGYNKVFGYYIELTHSQMRQMPDGPPSDYIRKQTLANCERYITPTLKEKEELVLNAEERIGSLESELFSGIRSAVAGEAAPLLRNARLLAEIDCLLSLATVALSQGYIRPELNTDGVMEIVEGRHPVLEAIQRDPPFVPNDTLLDQRDCQVALITGPNMAGKSTYIRQVALITLMAHMGG